ncbi:hypothetical protein [Paraburkholderia sp.]|uniref:hypothetical protein n=1 Tax=Paraburkholderia sp. TaxID=1926495 RepID=UPI003D6DC3A9
MSGKTVLVVLLLAGVGCIATGCYCLLQAFDVFDRSTDFYVWFVRAVVAMLIGAGALHAGTNRLGLR